MLMLDCAQSHNSTTQIIILINRLMHSQCEGERKLYKSNLSLRKKQNMRKIHANRSS